MQKNLFWGIFWMVFGLANVMCVGVTIFLDDRGIFTFPLSGLYTAIVEISMYIVSFFSFGLAAEQMEKYRIAKGYEGEEE